MARLTLVKSQKANTNLAAHRASATEGEAARRLLENNGFPVKRVANGQLELRCFAGETRYLTRDGMRTLAETVGTTQYVLDSSAQWVPAEIREFGKQPLMAVNVRRNKVEKTIYATPDHRWFRMTPGESKRRRRAHEVLTQDLQPGHRLAEMFPITRVRTSRGHLRVSPVGVMHGFVVGDGGRRGAGSVAYAYGDKAQSVLPYYGMQHFDKDEREDCVVVDDLPAYFKDWWPSPSEGASYLYGWLAGLFAADGYVSEAGQVIFYAADRALVEHVRDVAQRLGVQVYSIVRKDRQDVPLPQGGSVDSTLYSLGFNGESLTENFFLRDKHCERWLKARERQARSAPTGWTVVSVEETDRVETVYCAVVESSGTFTLEDNILTGNCPFHEGPGQLERNKGTKFYVHAETSVYHCHSASCGERGNLQTLERFFGVDEDEGFQTAFRDRDSRLKEFERNLTQALRHPFYEHGLTDTTIERFRLGYEPEHVNEYGTLIPGRYVIPYLEGRRPRFFRYYQPDGDPKFKYTWESGAESTLFNPQDAMGDANGLVILTEGELKAMMLVQMGYAAVAVPGAGQWKDEFQAAFTHAHKVIVCYDNDNPDFHNYDRPERGQVCRKCAGKHLDRCLGHNPGQEAALARVEQIGWRAKNVVLPLPDRNAHKTDVNDYFMRDGHSNADFAELATGKRATPYKVQSLAEISEAPPEEATFLIEQGILPKSGRLLIAGKPKVGKGEPLTHKLMTPYGWTEMGSIRVGSEVVGADGLSTTVRQVHPLGVKPIYRVTMSDGSSTECTAEHLWTIQTHNDREYAKKDGRPRWRTIDTMAVKALLDEGKTRHTYIPMVAPVEYHPGVAPQPIPAYAHDVGGGVLDPYALGLLIGDAHLGATPTFSKPDLELHEALAKSLPAEVHEIKSGEGRCRTSSISRRDGDPFNVVVALLEQLNLRGCRSWEKFIPESYLRASVEDRLALLQGLLDTDGWVQWNASGKNSSAYFGTSSEALKDGVVELVESLGGQVRVLHKPAPEHQGGVGRPAWSVRVRLPAQFEPFRLTRKLDEWRSGRTSKETEPCRRIVAVEYSHDEEAQCITVDREDGLYVTERFVVTHNSLFVNNLALSLAAGIPFLRRFRVSHPTRVLLLDRELSKWSLFQRLNALMEDRPGYRAAMENLLIDHDHLLRLDHKNAYDTLRQLVEQNGAEVVIMDTAYKFFTGDIESSSSLMRGFEVLDRVLHETGCSFVLTHHHKKGGGAKGRENTDIADPDNVAGSFLWTGWPNSTILLNYLERSVENPFNSVCTFTAFRDAAPPEPLALYRDRESISYSAIQEYSHDQDPVDNSSSRVQVIKPTPELVSKFLLECCPTTEEDFLHMAAGHFGVSIPTIRPYYVDVMSRGDFEKTSGKPPIIKFRYDDNDAQSWEAEHGLPERPIPDNAGAGLDPDGIDTAPMFDAAGLT